MANIGTTSVHIDGVWDEDCFKFLAGYKALKAVKKDGFAKFFVDSLKYRDFILRFVDKSLHNNYKKEFLNNPDPEVYIRACAHCFIKQEDKDTVYTLNKYFPNDSIAQLMSESHPGSKIVESWFIDGEGSQGEYIWLNGDVIQSREENVLDLLDAATDRSSQ